MSDFVEDNPIEVKVEDRVFLVKEPFGGEFDAWLEKYISILPSGGYNVDLPKKNAGILEFVVDAPYKVGDKDFKDASVEERVELLQKLKPTIRGALIKKINGLLEGDDKKKE